jgi:hypothetical protein
VGSRVPDRRTGADHAEVCIQTGEGAADVPIGLSRIAIAVEFAI